MGNRTLVIGALLLSTACSDSTPTTTESPDQPRVATVQILPDSVGLQLGRSADLEAEIRDESGNLMAGQQATWSSSNSGIATVTQSGQVTGVSQGTVTIQAEAGGRVGQASVTVHPWTIAENTIVVDSTVLRLVSDSSELAAGEFRFEPVGNDPPELSSGDVIAGLQGSSFLRQVDSVTTSSDLIVAFTTQAYLTQAVENGSLSLDVDLSPPSAVTGPFLRPDGEAGPGWVTVAEGVRYEAGQHSLTVDFCKLLSCPQNASLETSGAFSFVADADLYTGIENRSVEEFALVLDGTLDSELSIEAGVESPFADTLDVDLAKYTKVFFTEIGQVPVRVAFDVTLTLGIKGALKGGVALNASSNLTNMLRVGATYDGTAWGGVWEPEGTIQAGGWDWSRKAEGALEVYVTPTVAVSFMSVAGPEISLAPFLKAQATVGTEECAVSLWSAVDLVLAYDLEFAERNLPAWESGWTWLPTDLLDEKCPATITVAPGDTTVAAGDMVQFEGTVLDHDGTLLDGWNVGWSSSDSAVATVSQQGLATAHAAGSASVSASLAGVSGSADLTVAIPTLTFESDFSVPGIVGIVYQPFPTVRAMLGDKPAAGQPIQWSVAGEGHGWVFPISEVTDAEGYASAHWIPGGAVTQGIVAASPHDTAMAVINAEAQPATAHGGGVWVDPKEYGLAEGFKATLTPATDPYSTFYTAMQVDGAYFGMQSTWPFDPNRPVSHINTREEKIIIFSVWDDPRRDAELLEIGVAECREFEELGGTGPQCTLPYAWETGNPYTFELLQEDSPDYTDFAAYFTDEVLGERMLIARVRLKPSPNIAFASWIEDFGPPVASCLHVPMRDVTLTDPYRRVNGEWERMQSIQMENFLHNKCYNRTITMVPRGVRMTGGGLEFQAPFEVRLVPIEWP